MRVIKRVTQFPMAAQAEGDISFNINTKQLRIYKDNSGNYVDYDSFYISPDIDAISVNGYYPLYRSESLAIAASPAGTAHEHDITNLLTAPAGVDYPLYMPDGLVLGSTSWHGGSDPYIDPLGDDDDDGVPNFRDPQFIGLVGLPAAGIKNATDIYKTPMSDDGQSGDIDVNLSTYLSVPDGGSYNNSGKSFVITNVPASGVTVALNGTVTAFSSGEDVTVGIGDTVIYETASPTGSSAGYTGSGSFTTSGGAPIDPSSQLGGTTGSESISPGLTNDTLADIVHHFTGGTAFLSDENGNITQVTTSPVTIPPGSIFFEKTGTPANPAGDNAGGLTNGYFTAADGSPVNVGSMLGLQYGTIDDGTENGTNGNLTFDLVYGQSAVVIDPSGNMGNVMDYSDSPVTLLPGYSIFIKTVSAVDQTITLSLPATISLGAVTLDLSSFGTASSGLPITWSVSSSTSANGSISGNILTLVQAGNVAIEANQAGNPDYNPAPQESRQIVIEGVATGTVGSYTGGSFTTSGGAPIDPTTELGGTTGSESISPGLTNDTLADIVHNFTGGTAFLSDEDGNITQVTTSPVTIPPGSIFFEKTGTPAATTFSLSVMAGLNSTNTSHAVSIGGGIAGTVVSLGSGSGAYPISDMADVGYEFDKWVSVEGAAVTNATDRDNASITISDTGSVPNAVRADFKLIPAPAIYSNLTATADSNSSNATDYNTGDVQSGNTITLSANAQIQAYATSPNSCHEFDRWELTGGGSLSSATSASSATYTYGDSDGTVTATYRATTAFYTVVAGSNGTLANPPTQAYSLGCSNGFSLGQFTPTANTDYEFDEWTVAAGGGTFTDATSAGTAFSSVPQSNSLNTYTITATFKQSGTASSWPGSYVFSTEKIPSVVVSGAPDGAYNQVYNLIGGRMPAWPDVNDPEGYRNWTYPDGGWPVYEGATDSSKRIIVYNGQWRMGSKTGSYWNNVGTANANNVPILSGATAYYGAIPPGWVSGINGESGGASPVSAPDLHNVDWSDGVAVNNTASSAAGGAGDTTTASITADGNFSPLLENLIGRILPMGGSGINSFVLNYDALVYNNIGENISVDHYVYLSGHSGYMLNLQRNPNYPNSTDPTANTIVEIALDDGTKYEYDLKTLVPGGAAADFGAAVTINPV